MPPMLCLVGVPDAHVAIGTRNKRGALSTAFSFVIFAVARYMLVCSFESA